MFPKKQLISKNYNLTISDQNIQLFVWGMKKWSLELKIFFLSSQNKWSNIIGFVKLAEVVALHKMVIRGFQRCNFVLQSTLNCLNLNWQVSLLILNKTIVSSTMLVTLLSSIQPLCACPFFAELDYLPKTSIIMGTNYCL